MLSTEGLVVEAFGQALKMQAAKRLLYEWTFQSSSDVCHQRERQRTGQPVFGPYGTTRQRFLGFDELVAFAA